MTVYNRFSNGWQQTSVHDGYLELRATPRGDGLWNAALVGTSQGGNGPTFSYGVFRYWLSFNVAPATWQAAWLYDTTSWSATEIDFPEMLENQSLTAAVHGSGAGAAYGLPRPADLAAVFHEFKVERRPTFVAYSIDGVEVARVNGNMPANNLAILLDSKVGHPWMGAAGAPSGSTPNPTYLRIAAVTVDP
jgi:beta-glucanase (GH16 family)